MDQVDAVGEDAHYSAGSFAADSFIVYPKESDCFYNNACFTNAVQNSPTVSARQSQIISVATEWGGQLPPTQPYHNWGGGPQIRVNVTSLISVKLH